MYSMHIYIHNIINIYIYTHFFPICMLSDSVYVTSQLEDQDFWESAAFCWPDRRRFRMSASQWRCPSWQSTDRDTWEPVKYKFDMENHRKTIGKP